MQVAEQLNDINFERRYFEMLRLRAVAPEIGRFCVSAAYEDDEGYQQRRRDETVSALAEGLKPESVRSVISSHYPLDYRNEKIIAADGEDVEEMLLRAYKKDIKLAAADSFYAPFLPARSRSELDEHREQQAMARGQSDYNTIVTFSPYSEEFATTNENKRKLIQASQKPYWQRAMIRVSHWDGQQLHVFTRSIDNSSVGLLKDTAQKLFGYDFAADNSTDMLAERLKLSISDESWRQLADSITHQADDILTEYYGGRWKQGNPEYGVRDAHHYVESQFEAVEGLLRIGERLASTCPNFESFQEAYKQKIYDCIALLEQRLEQDKTEEKIINYEMASVGAGNVARAEGKSYDMCGEVISPQQNSALTTATQTGFESLRRLENKKIQCPDCKKKVIVPTEKLVKGILSCSACGYGVDVCTGKTFRHRMIGLSENQNTALEALSRWWRRQGEEGKIRKSAEILAKQELGGKVSYLDKKRYEEKVRRQRQNSL